METAEEIASRHRYLATFEAIVRPYGWQAEAILDRMKWQCEQYSKDQNVQGE